DPLVRERLGSQRIFAADVVPAVTMTFGGVEADDDGRVLGAGGEPIDGLYVAGGDMSDIYHRGYGGGLCAAAVTGRRAGAGTAAFPSTRASSSSTAKLARSPRPRPPASTTFASSS